MPLRLSMLKSMSSLNSDGVSTPGVKKNLPISRYSSSGVFACSFTDSMGWGRFMSK